LFPRYALWLVLGLTGVTAKAVQPVTLSFTVATEGANPFAREISAGVQTPSGRTLHLPAFYLGEKRFAIRARAEETGVYHLGKVTERVGKDERDLSSKPLEERGVEVREIERLQPVAIARARPGRFVFPDGQRCIPIGTNLAWAPEGGPAWYSQAFEQFGREHLNWMRIWMCSWGGLNLDWREKGVRSPEVGRLDLAVAARWDKLVDDADRSGVYLQVVLQHHGQYSSEVNPNWDDNPWNAKNPGGFLKSPGDFFVSEKARQLTKQKYRYIVARWGYSPAVLAWELFNEVHWVDAYRLQHHEAAVAAWHDEMAAYLRSIDVYRHLVTTSTDNVASPIYRSMDYYQPHLYTTTMLAAVRRFNLAPEREDRPIFYGEVGNDHMRVTGEQKAAAVEHVPLVWASIMGEGQLPAQIWEGDKLFARERVAELGAVARFLRATKLAERDGLKPFTARVDSSDVMPLAVSGGETWRKRDLVHLAVAMDGRQPAEYGIIPRYLVAEANHRKEGFPDRVQFEVDLPRASSAVLRIADTGPKGGGVTAIVDGNVVGTHAWKAMPKSKKEDGEGASADRGADLPLSIAAGKHTIEIRNTGGKDWIDFEKIEFDLSAPILAAAGKRDSNFIALWIWNQRGVFAAQTPKTVSGTLVIDDVPGGQWKVTWWDTETGTEAESTVIDHRGGALRLKAPQIARHAAVVLTR
jgi:hypothetical protein